MIVLAVLPLVILLFLIGLSIRDGEYGLPALLGAAVAVGLGPVMYMAARRVGGAAKE